MKEPKEDSGLRFLFGTLSLIFLSVALLFPGRHEAWPLAGCAVFSTMFLVTCIKE